MTIVDFDQVNLTNINRQNIALSNTVGRPKSEVMAERIALVNPECRINPLQEFFSEDNSTNLLRSEFSAVVDAIDSFNPKIRLLVDCLNRGIPVFSAMGAAGKIDPAQIRVGDISQTTICPLARRVRKILRGHGVESGFQVVYSIEPPIMPFSHTIIPADQKEPTLQRGRERMIQGTISYLPAIFGLTLAGMVVQHLLASKPLRILRPARSEFFPKRSLPAKITPEAFPAKYSQALPSRLCRVLQNVLTSQWFCRVFSVAAMPFFGVAKK